MQCGVFTHYLILVVVDAFLLSHACRRGEAADRDSPVERTQLTSPQSQWK